MATEAQRLAIGTGVAGTFQRVADVFPNATGTGDAPAMLRAGDRLAIETETPLVRQRRMAAEDSVATDVTGSTAAGAEGTRLAIAADVPRTRQRQIGISDSITTEVR